VIRFEGYERRIAQINKCMAEYGFNSLEEVRNCALAKVLMLKR